MLGPRDVPVAPAPESPRHLNLGPCLTVDLARTGGEGVASGVVYYGDGSGDVVRAYDAATGKKLWGSGSLITDGVWSAPLVANGRLFVGSWDCNLYACGPRPEPIGRTQGVSDAAGNSVS